MSTLFVKNSELKAKQWQVVDAKDQVVGRIATKIARILSGKTKTDFTPHVETGDGVIVLNAAHVRVTGNKAKDKIYTSFSGYPSGIKRRSFERVMSEDPTFAITHAVKGMLPKSRLGKSMLTRLLVYAGNEHPHQAQKPKLNDLKG
jgi:large subunit ribosomal protein L13